MIQLRPYQAEAVAAVYDHLRNRDDNPCVVIPTAGGKTPVMSSICRDAVTRWGGRVLILAHVKELLEQAVDKLHAMAPDLWNRIGVHSAGLKSRDTEHPIIVAGIQSVYRRAAELDAFDLILVDECFPAGTMVSTPRGDIAIEDLYVGQPVHTALGVGEVEAISARPTCSLIELEFEDGSTVRCTPNHPFLTERGWKQAKALEVGTCLFSREDMQVLRHDYTPGNLQESRWDSQELYGRKEVEREDVLLENLQLQSANWQATDREFSRTMEIGTDFHCKQDMRMLRDNLSALDQTRQHRWCGELYEGKGMETAAFLFDLLFQEGRKRDVDSERSGESSSNTSTKRGSTASQRGQRSADKTAEAIARKTGPRMGCRICSHDRSTATEEDAEQLQTGFSESKSEDCNRAGRHFTYHDKPTGTGQARNGLFAKQRLARIAHIKCESPVPVFNLQVTGHPSYYANGVLAHNCHLIPPDGEGMYRTFLAEARTVNPNVRLIGLTATPYRMTTGKICAPDHLLNHVCYKVGVRELIVQGYLCPLKTKAGRRKVDTSELHLRGGEFIAGEVEAMMNDGSLVQSACMEIVEHTQDRHSVLIFAAGVQHAIHVQRVLAGMGRECGFVCGETLPFERADTLKRFKDGDLKYLVNVNVLTTGFDAPNIDCVTLLRPTNSPGLYYQMVGRGFRLDPSKNDCMVLDFGGNILRHGPVDALEIKDRSTGNGEAPAKECPRCQAVIHASYATCPECGHEFPLPKREQHDDRASTENIISGEVTETEIDIQNVYYSVHRKRGASDDYPRTMRVDYRAGFNDYHSEWVCPEHKGYARKKFEAWWRVRSGEPLPNSAEEAVKLADAGGVATVNSITVRSVAGEKYDRITDYQLGPIPPRLDGSDERDNGDLSEPVWPDDDIPF